MHRLTMDVIADPDGVGSDALESFKHSDKQGLRFTNFQDCVQILTSVHESGFESRQED